MSFIYLRLVGLILKYKLLKKIDVKINEKPSKSC